MSKARSASLAGMYSTASAKDIRCGETSGTTRLLKMLLNLLTANALLMMAIGEARVVRFVVEQKRVFADGKSFGDVGRYERLDGIAYLEVDPRNPLNAAIVNLDKAPQSPHGTVEF